MKYKVGDLVTVTKGKHQGSTGRVNGIRTYKVLTPDYAIDDIDDNYCFTDDELTSADPMKNLKPGDVLINKGGREKEVLFATDKVVIVDDGYDDTATFTLMVSKLSENGWKLKPSDTELKEVTLEEVAKSMNIPVEQLRIKDSK